MANGLVGLRRRLTLSLRLVRFQAFSFAAMLALLGAVSATPRLSGLQVAVILAAALSFHVFAHALNDYVDLPIDRTQRLRRGDPLVQGAVRPGLLLGIALVQLPLAPALIAPVHPPAVAYLTFAAACLAIAIYDVWGKRGALPPTMDAAQGIGWALMLLVGAQVTGVGATRLTGALMLFVVVFVALINGAHGSLRDLANDLACGARTTAIFLGVRPGARGLTLTVPFVLYALVLQTALTGVLLTPIALNWLGYGNGMHSILLVAVAALLVLAVGFWPLLPWLARSQSRLFLGAVIYILLLLCTLAIPFLPLLDTALRVVLAAALFLPLLASGRYEESPFATVSGAPGRSAA